jgi:hypothetical protein
MFAKRFVSQTVLCCAVLCCAALRVPPYRAAADSPALLVHAPDRRDAFGLLGSSLLGSTFSQLYPAMLGLTSAGGLASACLPSAAGGAVLHACVLACLLACLVTG